jgi:hypothetical protein
MIVSLSTFNGHSINDLSDYRATGLNLGTPAAADAEFVPQASADPVYAGVWTSEARSLAISIEILDDPNRDLLYQQLKVWFRRGTHGLLVGTYSTDGVEYQIPCTVASLSPQGRLRNHFIAILMAGPATWRAVSAETAEWEADEDAMTKTITVGGIEETRLSVDITPTSPPVEGWQFQRLYQLVNAAGVSFGAWPWCIQIDTEALIAAGKMKSDCSDLRVTVNEQDVKRWISGANTSATKIWFTPTLGPGYNLTLLTQVPSTGNIGELQFRKTANNLAALKALPARGILANGTEWIQYSGKNLTLYKLGVEARGALGTTLQQHNAGSVFKYIQNTVYLIYGNPSASDPANDDADYDVDKPVFDLTDSSNTTWVYKSTSMFYDPQYPNRPGAFRRAITRVGNESKLYSISQDAESGSAAAGSMMGTWQKSGTWRDETANIRWGFHAPCGIAEVSCTGSKYRNTSRWPTQAALLKYTAANTWVTVWNETTPVSASTWTAFTRNNSVMSDKPQRLQVRFRGTLRALANADCYFEILTASITFDTTKLPTGTLLSEAGNYPLTVKLTNATTGDEIVVTYPMLVNKTLSLNGEDYLIDYEGVNAHGALQLNDPARGVWIRLLPGENELVLSTDEIGEMTLALSWYPRQP